MKVAFYTLGCKVNQYETQILAQNFGAGGYEIVEHTESADVYVINSCTVTATGDRKTRQILRQLRARNPQARIVLTGCFPQAFPEAAALLTEADIITGTKDRGKLLAVVEESMARDVRVVRTSPHESGEVFEPMHAQGAGDHTRAFVKIEDGCERYCAYCIIPTARGPVRSKPLDSLESELRELADAGYREIVLTGINLACYGKEQGLRLVDAVELACTLPEIARVRLGSLEPELLTDTDIARLAALPKLCPQFHLSLQSGCDATLRRMNRHYTTEEYGRLVDTLRGQLRGCAITTDIMVGFPAETEAEFAQSLAFAERIAFAQAHVFAYSKRAGTRAAQMPQQISNAEKAERSVRMIEATRRTQAEFLKAQLGRTVTVLFEHCATEGMGEGHTECYTMVRVRSPENLHRKLREVRITGVEDDCCTGVLL